MVALLTATGGDEFVVDDIKAFIVLSLSVVCGKMLAAMIVATSIQLAYSAKSALTNYERKVGELVDVLRNQGLSSKLHFTTILRRQSKPQRSFSRALLNYFPLFLSRRGNICRKIYKCIK